LIQSVSIAFSTLSTPRNPAAWGWGYRFAGRSSVPTAAGSGPMRIHLAEPYFSSPCPALEMNSRILVLRIMRLESRMEAPYETLLADRLAEITHDSIAQGVSPLVVVWAASNDDRGNGVPHIDKVSVEFDAGVCTKNLIRID
jgi:hypothetical protein